MLVCVVDAHDKVPTDVPTDVLHDNAQVDLPLVSAPVELQPDGGGSKRKRAASVEKASASASAAGGELLASESFSPSALVGTETLDGEPGAADEPSNHERGDDRTATDAVRIDFSSLDALSRDEELGRVEKRITAEMAEKQAQLVGMAPNMKALEQFDEQC